MRLIDADEFKKQIIAAGALFNAGMDKINALCKIVDNQPTAQDDAEKLKEFLNRIDKAYEDVYSAEKMNTIFPDDGTYENFYNIVSGVLYDYDDFMKKNKIRI